MEEQQNYNEIEEEVTGEYIKSHKKNWDDYFNNKISLDELYFRTEITQHKYITMWRRLKQKI